MEVYFVTKNPHKFSEVSSIAPGWLKLQPLPDWVPEIRETGSTFLENALKKALECSRILNSPVLADDSGLEIQALDGFPGVHSARFLESRDYVYKMSKILKLLEGEKDRSARFICHAVFHVPDSITLAVVGEIKGEISRDIRGNLGFGYDPIFIPEGFEKTFGELGEEVKNMISHRSRAFKKLFAVLEKIHFSGF